MMRIVLLVSLLAPAALPAASPALLLPGQYHADEVADASAGNWLALVPGEGEDTLASTAVAVDAVPDPIFGDDDTGTSGRRVSTPQLDTQALFLVSNVAGLSAGKITTVIGEPHDLARDAPLRMFLGNAEQNRLDLDCHDAEDTQDKTLRCALIYTRGDHSQQLAEFSGTRAESGQLYLGDEANPSLLWSGDLDRDGRLDFLLDLSDHYNVSRPTLFLSTRAAAGELIGRVAERRSVGC